MSEQDSTSSEHESAEPARQLPPLSLRGLVQLFARTYLSHFLLPSLIFTALMHVSSEDVTRAIVFLVASALLVSASQRALRQTTIFSERRIRRVVHRTMILVATCGLLGVAMSFLMVPLIPVGVALGSNVPLWTVLIGFALAATARLWPIYVTQYLFRDSGLDPFRNLFSAKLPDAGIAWRLTGTPGAFLRATVPVLLAVAITIVICDAAWTHLRATKPLWIPFKIFLYMGLLPFLHLLIMERAWVLAACSDNARAALRHVERGGPLWWVRGWQAHDSIEEPSEDTGPTVSRSGTPVAPLTDPHLDQLDRESREDPQKRLEYAISEGRVDWFEQAIAAGADPGGTDERGRRLVALAVRHERVEILSRLIDLGVSVTDRISREGVTPLQVAVQHGHDPRIVELLLMAGADPNHPRGPTSPLFVACRRKDDPTPFLNLLESAGLRINVRTDRSWTPLMQATRSGNLAAVNWLLAAGAAIDDQVEDSSFMAWTPLAFAVSVGALEVIRVLEQHGADVRDRIEDRTLIMLAADFGQLDTIRYLMEQGVDPRATDDAGRTALYYAEFQDRPDARVVELIRRHLNLPV